MGNLGDPTEIEREMQEMQETYSMRRQRQLIEELQEMEEEEEDDEEEELEFFEQHRLDLIRLSEVIESLEARMPRYELDVQKFELNNRVLSGHINFFRINKENAEIKFQEKKKEREDVKASVEYWMLWQRNRLRTFKESLNVINSENYSLGRKIIEINDLIKELDFAIHNIDEVNTLVRSPISIN